MVKTDAKATGFRCSTKETEHKRTRNIDFYFYFFYRENGRVENRAGRMINKQEIAIIKYKMEGTLTW